MVLFANYKIHVIKKSDQGNAAKAHGGQRVMYTTHHPSWDAKNRHDLPNELKLDYNEIAHVIPLRGKPEQAESKPVEEAQEEVASAVELKVEESKAQEPKAQEPKDDLGGIPKALADLMKANEVTAEEIQKAVATRGYYPADTAIANYDADFINGVLIGAWGQLFKMIENARLPF